MATSQIGHKFDKAESNSGVEDSPSICPNCAHFDAEWTSDQEGYFQGKPYRIWFCDAKDEDGNDLHYDGEIDNYFKEYCPYFIMAETHEK